MPDAYNHVLPGGTNDSWRTWLTTGARRGPVDRRRLRGAHRGLKRMMLEGAGDPKRPHSWKEFSDAMVRHAVDEAMQALPVDETRVVKLAFFGGYSNREIASEMRLTEATVQRRLRDALDRISEYVQRGRYLGRRAIYGLVAWLAARSLSQAAHQAFEAATVAAAATIVVTAPAVSPVVAPPSSAQTHVTTAVSVAPPPAAPAASLPAAAGVAGAAGAAGVAAPSVTAPALPLPSLPALPPVPPVPAVQVPAPPPVNPPGI